MVRLLCERPLAVVAIHVGSFVGIIHPIWCSFADLTCSIDDGEGSKDVTFKMSWRFKLCRVYSNSLKMCEGRRICMELISWGLHSSLERERKIRRFLFTSSTKRKIGHFHVVFVQ